MNDPTISNFLIKLQQTFIVTFSISSLPFYLNEQHPQRLHANITPESGK